MSFSLKKCYNNDGDYMMIVFGGAFNPPTIAHLNIIKKLLSTYKGSHVLLLPVGNDYSKSELIDINHRIKMLQLMIDQIDCASVSEIEANRKYQGTLASLNELSKIDKDIHFVIGLDNLLGIKRWIKYQELLEKYPFIVMDRKGSVNKEEADREFADLKHDFTFVDFDEDISSTLVREDKENREKLLTKEISNYIIKNHLYEE
mgnify:FL=1